jgi:RHS repeat-associated protein
VSGTCGTASPESFTAVSDGYQINVTDAAYGLYDGSGKWINAPINYGGNTAAVIDRNGNQINANSSGQFYDTLSSTAPVLAVAGSGTPSSPITFTYTAPNGQPAAYHMNYTNYTVATNFGVSGIGEYRSGAAVPLVTSIVLPDGSGYTFGYEPTPGSCTPYSGTTCTTARLASVTLPTGGTINYAYIGGNNGILPDGSAATLRRTTPDGIWTYARTLGTGLASTTTITDPQNNVTTIQFQDTYETQRVVNQGSSTVLQTTNTCYNGAASPCTGTSFAWPITQRNVTATLAGSLNLTDLHVQTYDTSGFNNLLEQDDYDYASGSHGGLLRKITATYAPLGPIGSFPKTVTVSNGTATVSQTTNNYDETGVTSTSGTPQHTSVTNPRGNLTSVNTYTIGSTYLTKRMTYFDTGNVQTSTDVNNATYTSVYNNATSTCGNAFPSSVNEPLSMSKSFTWNCTGGVQLTATDENNKATTTTYSDQFFWRPANTAYPDGGQTSWTYNSVTSTTTTVKMNGSQNVVSTTVLDSLGRTKQTQLNSDPIAPDYVDTTYDSLGRVYTVSNPYRTTSDATYGLTKYQYDALSRPTLVIPPDGSQSANNVSATYTNNCAAASDQAGKKRTSCSNALGYLTQVFEDPTGLNYETDYSVDPLGNILSVSQKGGDGNSAHWRTRNYVYDLLSRLAQSSNPESGTVNYYYDANGYSGDLTSRVAPAPNQSSGTVTTTYAYDLLHRITQKSYSDGTTPAMYYWYDVHPTWGATWVTNVVGRLVEAKNQYAGTTGLGTSTVNSYDTMGRITNQWQQTPKFAPSGTNLYYSFDLAGDMLSASDGVATISYGYDTAGRPSTVTSNLNDSQHPPSLATLNSSVAYFPNSVIRKMGLGNGLTQTQAVNNTLEPCRVNLNSSGTALGACGDATPAGNLLDLTTGFSAGTANNGNVTSWSAVGQQTFNRTYSYDSLNRLYTMSDSISGQPCRGLSWNYDAWGNLTNQNVTAGSCASFQALAGTNNQLASPFTYDAAGNMTYDGAHHYFYDAEDRLIQVDGTLGTCSSATVCYVYDANGHRVEHIVSGGSQDYFFDLQGKVVSDYTFSSSYTGWGAAYVYLGSQFLAQYSNGTTYFVTQDHLGSTRLLTGTNQSVTESPDYYPYGQRYSGDNLYTTHEFAGTIWDPETGFNHAQFRQYTPIQNRWMTPDPAGLAAVDPSTPQTLNRYAYVTNSPLVYTDPTGMDGCDFSCGDITGGTGIITGPIWGENLPIYTGPSIDPRLVIQNVVRSDPNGNLIGDLGDSICNVDQQGNCIEWLFWSPGTQKWEKKPVQSTEDKRANALGLAINKTGVQSLQNPCTVAGFYSVSAIGGAVTNVGVVTQATEAAAEAWPNLLVATRNWLTWRAPTAAQFVLSIPNKIDKVLNSCNAMQ